MRLFGARVLGFGVKVAVQTVPSPVLATVDRVPFENDKSLLAKPVTGSLKVNVTCAVSPAVSAVSLIAIDSKLGTVVLTL